MLLGCALLLLGACTTPHINGVFGLDDSIKGRVDTILERAEDEETRRYAPSIAKPPPLGDLVAATVGNFEVYLYRPRFLDVAQLRPVLMTILEGTGVLKIEAVPDTSQILLKVRRSGQEGQVDPPTLNDLRHLLAQVDVKAPLFRIDVRIYKIFADHTSSLSALMKAESGEDLLPFFNLNLKGAEMRTPGVSAIGAEYGVLGRIGDYSIRSTLNRLVSRGYAEDIANPSIVVVHGHEATISKTVAVPIPRQTVVGTSIISTTSFEKVANFLHVKPSAAADGLINLELHVGTGAVTPTGPTQVPAITTRETKIGKVRIQQGRTLAIGSYLDSKTLGIGRKSPPFTNVPIFGELFKGVDTEKRRDMIVYLVRPFYVADAVNLDADDE